MALSYEVRCTGRSHFIGVHNGHFYVLADGSTSGVNAWPVWCDGCRSFTMGEWLPSVAELREAIAECEYYAARPGWIPHDRYVGIKELPDLRVRAMWRAARVGPPRCLECGSASVILSLRRPVPRSPGTGGARRASAAL